jgi:hypothetical protein
VRDIFPLVEDAALSHPVAPEAHDGHKKGRLPGAVLSEEDMSLSPWNLEVDPFEDFLALDADVQIPDFEHVHVLPSGTSVERDYPTLPSRLTSRSRWASTANSMGSSRKTSLQKPLTIMLTASGYEVVDLGRDVPTADFIEKAKSEGAQVIAMSTLLDKGMKRARNLALSIFPVAGVVLALLLLFL